MHRLAQSVLGYIRKHDLLCAGDRVGVAVSGGSDSVALLRLMLELQDGLGIVLSVVHLNHKLRGADSDADEQFVRDLAASNGLAVISGSCDVKAHAAEKKLSVETAGRELRYGFFRGVLQSHVNRIATAHTLDDQAETVLLKLSRGTGTRGLAGIYPKLTISHQSLALSKSEPERLPADEASIVRPVLGVQRLHLREYLTGLGQNWREDASNQDQRHTRNRIRHQILPILEKDLNPSLREVLAETAEIARVEEDYWSAEVNRVLPDVWLKHAQNTPLRIEALRGYPLAVQRRLIRAAAESLGFALEFRHVEEILRLRNEGDCAALPNSWLSRLRQDEIEFCRRSGETLTDYAYELPLPGRLVVPEIGIEIEALVCCREEQNQKYSPEHLVGAEFVRSSLVIRNWRPGERFWPAHSKRPTKIKELLQDRHITGERKRLWPVVVSGDEIVWLRGFGVRRDYQSSDGLGVVIREGETSVPD